MAITVVEKKKGTRTCGECGAEVPADATACSECGSENIKKSLVIVRKAVGDEDDDLEAATASAEVEEDEEDLEDEDDEEEEEEEEDDEEEDDEEEDEEEEDEDDDAPPAGVKKADVPLLGLEALNISTAAAEDIVKVFAEGKGRNAYEEVMVEFNNIMDSAADKWFGGSVVSKSDDSAGHAALIRERVNGIISKEKTMARPKNFDNLDPETKKYIEELEGSEDAVTKSAITKRDDLPEDVRKSLEAADRIVEERESEKWLNIAKGYSHFPGDKVELSKTLRRLATADNEAFEELKKSLDAAEYNLSQSDIFKSYGQPGGGEPSDEISKRRKAAEELVSKGEYDTIEQAEVALMGGSDYTATNAQ